MENIFKEKARKKAIRLGLIWGVVALLELAAAVMSIILLFSGRTQEATYLLVVNVVIDMQVGGFVARKRDEINDLEEQAAEMDTRNAEKWERQMAEEVIKATKKN